MRKGGKVIKTTTTNIMTQHDIYNGMLKEGTRAAVYLPVYSFCLICLTFSSFYNTILHTTVNSSITNSSRNQVEYKSFQMKSSSV